MTLTNRAASDREGNSPTEFDQDILLGLPQGECLLGEADGLVGHSQLEPLPEISIDSPPFDPAPAQVIEMPQPGLTPRPRRSKDKPPEGEAEALVSAARATLRQAAETPILTVHTLLESHPALQGKIKFNAMSREVVVFGRLPWDREQVPPDMINGRVWDDTDDLRLAKWVEEAMKFHPRGNICSRVVDSVARYHQFHPFRDYLTSLPEWDRISRLEEWAITYLGAPSEGKDGAWARLCGPKWWVSLVARQFEPGCQADSMLVLVGPQGVGKSTALRIIGGPFYKNNVSAVNTKDALINLAGAALIELDELDALAGQKSSTIKSFVSRREDDYRSVYDKRSKRHLRHCVLAGTTNEMECLSDDTGERRFWALLCTKLNLHALERDRDQLFAEALYAYRYRYPDGSRYLWYMADSHSQELAKYAAAQRKIRPDWWDDFLDVLDNLPVGAELDQPTLRSVMPGLGTREMDQKTKRALSGGLEEMGWERRQGRRDGGRNGVYYVKPLPKVEGQPLPGPDLMGRLEPLVAIESVAWRGRDEDDWEEREEEDPDDRAQRLAEMDAEREMVD